MQTAQQVRDIQERRRHAMEVEIYRKQLDAIETVIIDMATHSEITRCAIEVPAIPATMVQELRDHGYKVRHNDATGTHTISWRDE